MRWNLSLYRKHSDGITATFRKESKFSLPFTESRYLATSKATLYEPIQDQYLMVVEVRKDAAQEPRLPAGTLLEFHFPKPVMKEGEGTNPWYSIWSSHSHIIVAEPEVVKTCVISDPTSPITMLSDPIEIGPRPTSPIVTYLGKIVIYSDETKATVLGTHYQLFIAHPTAI